MQKIRLLPRQFYLLDEDKPFILIDIPSCEKNKNTSRDFIKKDHHFSNGKHRVSINWITKKVRSLFPFKDNNIYPNSKIKVNQN